MTSIRSTPRTLIAVLAFVLLSVVLVEAPASAIPGDSVRDWNLNASNALFNPSTGSPPGAGMALPGLLHLAMVQGDGTVDGEGCRAHAALRPIPGDDLAAGMLAH